MSTVRLMVSLALFQMTWFVAVGGAAGGQSWLGPVTALALAFWHLVAAERPARELGALAWVTVVGTAWDSVPAATGLIGYHGGTLVAGAAPYWIAALWLAFATTLNVSLRWLRGRYVLSALIGAIAGPLSYWAGDALGALRLGSMPAALVVQSVAWAVLLPFMISLAAHFDGVTAARQSTKEPAHV